MPIDVASGNLHLEYLDASVPGKIELTWDRLYSVAYLSRPPTPLGSGWTSRYFATLQRNAESFEFHSPSGSLETVPDPDGVVDRGGVMRVPEAFLEISREGPHYVIESWDAESGDIWRYRFTRRRVGEPWPLDSIEDVAGHALDLLRDERGALVGIRQRLERRTLQLAYDAQGHLASAVLVGAAGARLPIATYEHDANGQLVAAYDALGHPARYQYDATGRLTREVAIDGGVTAFRYDQRGRCVRTAGLDRYDEKTLRYREAAGVTEVIDSHGAARIYRYRADGQIVSIADPLGGVTTTDYDDVGRIVAERRPSGATTTYAYDGAGNRSRITNARGGVCDITFNGRHQVVGLIDPGGHQWQRTYDGASRLVATVDPNGARWEIQYDEAGNPVAIINPLGIRRRQEYVNGVVVETTDWRENGTRIRTDPFGRVIERQEPQGRRFAFGYDLVGNLIQVLLPDGGIVKAEYDAGRNLSRLTDPRGATTRYRYGPCQRLLERTDPNGNRTTYAWDTEPGRLKAVTNPKGEVYSFEYNALGLVSKETSFDSRVYTYNYTADGWCSEVVNGQGEVIRIDRDPEGRMLEQHLPDGGHARYEYDPLGNVVSAVNQSIALTIERDPVGRVVRETQGEHWVQSRRDLVGNRVQLETSLGHSAAWELDANGDATHISTGDGRLVESRWDAGRHEVLRTMSERLQLRQAFDICGRLAEQRLISTVGVGEDGGRLRLQAPETVVQRLTSRDLAGVPTAIEDSRWGTTRYSYDLGSRLTATTRQLGSSESFEYDSTGNITTLSGGQNGAETLTYGPGDRLLRKDGVLYEYDAQGRLTTKTQPGADGAPQIWRYSWDALDQLQGLTCANGDQWHYAYDGFGRRIAKRGPQGATQFVWDGDVVIHELRSQQDWASWLYADQSRLTPIAKLEGQSAYWIISDHLATPREMVDELGQIRWSFRGLSYGGGAPEINDVDNPFRFQGQYYDHESGLHYNRFRYFDPQAARYIQQDPLALVGSENLYWYAPNPTSWLDPFGLTTASCRSGERGREKAIEDMKKAGFTIVGEEVTMIVNGERIRADFVVEKNGRLYVFEVKNGTGGLTENQTNSGAFNMGNPANQNGEIRTSGGSAPPGSVQQFTVATDNAPPRVGDRNDTGTATFAVLKYDGSPGSRVK